MQIDCLCKVSIGKESWSQKYRKVKICMRNCFWCLNGTYSSEKCFIFRGVEGDGMLWLRRENCLIIQK